MKRILSLGVGVNSTALLVLKAQGKVEFDVAVFADTGGEHPETYRYFHEVILPFCMEHEIELARVKSDKPPLYDFYFSKHIIPTRRFRHCTDHYKIKPLKKYAMQKYPDEEIQFLIGFATDEAHRAKEDCGSVYPLLELGIDREGCKRVIIEAGLPLPIKSGCYFCPFTKKQGWLNLLNNHKALFVKAEELEKNCSRYPEFTLTNKPLERVRKNVEDQQSLCDWVSKCPICEVEG